MNAGNEKGSDDENSKEDDEENEKGSDEENDKENDEKNTGKTKFVLFGEVTYDAVQ